MKTESKKKNRKMNEMPVKSSQSLRLKIANYQFKAAKKAQC